MEVTLTPFIKLTHRTGGAMVVRTDDISSIVPLASGCSRITLRDQTIHECEEKSEELADLLTGRGRALPAEKTPPTKTS